MLEINNFARRIWYQQPAQKWVEALPIGNGHLGGMIFGGVKKDRIQLNEDTLWSGRPRDTNNYDAHNYLEEARHLIFAGKYGQAQDLIEKHMLSSDTESYHPMGNLYLDCEVEGEIIDYQRQLDIEKGIVTINFATESAKYQRQIFCSHPDQAILIHLTSDKSNAISFTASLDSLHHYSTSSGSEKDLLLDARCPVHTVPRHVHSGQKIVYEDKVSRGIGYRIQLKAIVDGGILECDGTNMEVSNANNATIILVAASSFNGFDQNPDLDGKDQKAVCQQMMDQVSSKDYSDIMKSHVQDYQSLFQRVKLELEEPLYPGLPTDLWLEKIKTEPLDPALVALYFDYGRYLLIASSRAGTQPANLQGIWNDQLHPPWGSDYTTNINVEMNYWPAEVCNLAECHTPLFDLIDELVITGGKTARIHYNCHGWTAHHNVDLWRHSVPVTGSARWAFWPMAGAWLCQHLWEHYAFSQDQDFLRKRAYPAMKGAALFLLDWLVSDEDGNLTTCPSTSPENDFIAEDGRHVAVAHGSTMDLSLIWDLFTNLITASKILDIDSAFRRKLETAKLQLPPLRVGSHGQLQEWCDDFDEAEPGHRHVSHLFGLYPGKQILKHQQPCLSEACSVSLKRRIKHGGGHTGWSCAWLINLFARLEDGEQAYQYVKTLLRRSTYDNLFDAHPPFQIDGNFGGIAGIAEMLLQSHADEISFLPALPLDWPSGSCRGLRARGGFVVDLAWHNARLTQAKIYAETGKSCRIRSPWPIMVKSNNQVVNIKKEAGVISFDTEPGLEYEIIVI